MIKFVKRFWPILTLSSILLILFIQNYTPGTFLTGWDNLHPEFNIWANLKRSIFSVWQEYQGLGLLAGMAHAADLPHQIFVLILSLFLPTSFIRYFYHFSMMALGSFGTYFLIKDFLHSKLSSPLPCLIGALFYLLNFGSVQYFSLPFEPYSTFWGFFPWLILSLLIYLHQPSRFKLYQLLTFNLLAVPAFYVQTIFLVYFICILLILFSHFITDHRSLITNLKVILIILSLNSFWLLPNIYFTLTSVSVTQNATANLMITDQFIEQNQKRGHPTDLALFLGPYYDIQENTTTTPTSMFLTWQQHFSRLPVQIIGYFLFLSALTGIVLAPPQAKKVLLPILIFSLVGFLSATFPVNYLNHLFRQVPILNQVFRNSFTKLLVPASLSLSVSLAFTINLFRLPSIIYLPLILILSWPSFLGHFIHPTMRVTIPPEYFQLFDYLKTQDSQKRIMNLPQHNFWGWNSHTWGYLGSGFLWYGIDQPILSRTFDVWSDQLENYYWQLHYALISRDPTLLNAIFKKYNISYVLYDPTVVFTDAGQPFKLNLENLKAIEDSSFLTLEKSFGRLKLYKVNLPTQANITLFDSLPKLYLSEPYNHFDPAFLDYGHYLSDSNSPQVTYPFGSLFTSRPQNYHLPIPVTSESWTECVERDQNHTAINQSITNFFDCSYLPLDTGYLLEIKTTNIAGRPPIFTVFSIQDNRLFFNTKIPNPGTSTNYYVLPPIYKFDAGIGINFVNTSLSSQPTTNIVNQARIAPIPWSHIVNTKSFSSPTVPASASSVPLTHHLNQAFYQIKVNTPASILTLFQSYHPGWLAFGAGQHLLINNWANGWEIPTGDHQSPITIYLIFWPQLLEFIGLVLIPVAFYIVLKKS